MVLADLVYFKYSRHYLDLKNNGLDKSSSMLSDEKVFLKIILVTKLIHQGWGKDGGEVGPQKSSNNWMSGGGGQPDSNIGEWGGGGTTGSTQNSSTISNSMGGQNTPSSGKVEPTRKLLTNPRFWLKL